MRDLDRLIEILLRTRRNNPMLIGEPGVGKTALVEALTKAIEAGEAPPSLRRASVRTVDLVALQAGASLRGEFEKRLKDLIAEAGDSERPTILFVDEAHMLIGAGDAANIFKPALARGEIRMIAATTFAEYKRHIEKDAALARRFEPLVIEEPDDATTLRILRGLAPGLANHYGLPIRDAALSEAIQLARRFLPERRLPESAIGALDAACAKAAALAGGPPPPLVRARARLTEAEAAEARLRRDPELARAAAELGETLAIESAQAREALDGVERRLAQERELAQRIRSLEDEWLTAPTGGARAAGLAETIEGLTLELEELQADGALVPLAVDRRAVATIVSELSGAPLSRMIGDGSEAVADLAARLGERVVGQEAALDAIARRLRSYHAGLSEPDKPAGVFLLAGPSGVGKTETALALADLLFGGESHLICVNLSEYQEAHSVSGLRGAPPGYVGHGKGGMLTEAVRRKRYAVLLLDEAEKAHVDVMELFYQVFDKGALEDSDGLKIDCRNLVILVAVNLGAEVIETLCARPGPQPSTAELEAAIRPALSKHFKPALMGRMTLVPYRPLNPRLLARIAALKLGKLQERVAARHGAELSYERAIVDRIVAQCSGSESGARAIDHYLAQTLTPDLAEAIQARRACGEAFALIHARSDRGGGFAFEFSGRARRRSP